jgi:hypothetical protein
VSGARDAGLCYNGPALAPRVSDSGLCITLTRRDEMTSSTWKIKEAVQRVLDDLPAEKIEEVLNFALFLKARWTAQGESKATVPESTALILHTLPAAHLDRLTGLVPWGGDAVADAERLYDDHA